MLKNDTQGLKAFDWTMLGIVVSIYLIWRIGTVGGWNRECWILLLVSLIGVNRDRADVEWGKFFLAGIPLLAVFYYFYGSGNSIWWKLANYMFKNNQYPFRWDAYMNDIPLNTGAWTRMIFKHPSLDQAMRWIYNYGFVLSLWICIVRSYWTRDVKKLLSYAMSGHLLQFPLILPFYNLFLIHEVWFVNKQPDLLRRVWESDNQMLYTVANCFPSMHTSISFAMLLLALREKDRIFKYIMITYCSAVIYSTMYLQIHWVVDVIAGMLFAYGVVKLSDGILLLASKKMPVRIRAFYGRKRVPSGGSTLAA